MPGWRVRDLLRKSDFYVLAALWTHRDVFSVRLGVHIWWARKGSKGLAIREVSIDCRFHGLAQFAAPGLSSLLSSRERAHSQTVFTTPKPLPSGV